MKVAVLDPDLIPDLVDVVIGDFVYELQFRVEKDMSDGEPQVIDMDSTMDEDKALEEKGPENMDHDGKKMEDPPAVKHLKSSLMPQLHRVDSTRVRLPLLFLLSRKTLQPLGPRKIL